MNSFSRSAWCYAVTTLLALGCMMRLPTPVAATATNETFTLGFMQSMNLVQVGAPVACYAAFQMAIDEINNANPPILLPDSGDRLLGSLLDVAGLPYGPFFQSLKGSNFCSNQSLLTADGIVGPLTSNDAIQAAGVLGLLGIPLVSHGSAAPELSNKALYPTFRRLIISNGLAGRGTARMCQSFGWKKVAIISTSDSFGIGYVQAFSLAAKEYGIEIVMSQSFATGSAQSAITPVVSLIRDSGAFIICAFAIGNDWARISAGAQQLDMFRPPYQWIGTNAIINQLPYGGFGLNSNGNISLPAFVSFKNRFTTRFPAIPFPTNIVSTPFAYDAVYMYAYTIRKYQFIRNACRNGQNPPGTGSEFPSNICQQFNTLTRPLLLNLLLPNTTLTGANSGASGDVILDRNGDRLGLCYIANNQNDTSGSSIVGTVSVSNSGDTVATFYPEAKLVFPDGTATVTPDSLPVCIGAYHRSSAVTIVIYVLCALSLFGLSMSIGGIIALRRRPSIRSASPKFCVLILIGCMLCIIHVILRNISPATANTCASLVWVSHFGIGLIFGPLFAKTFRLHRIFNNARLIAVGITDTELFAATGLFVVALTIYLALWSSLSQVAPIQVIVDAANHTCDTVCASPNPDWSFALIGVEASVLVMGAVITYSVRNIPDAFNESAHIGSVLYTVFFSAVVVLPVVFLAGSVPDTAVLIEQFAFILVTNSCAGILFVPKFLKSGIANNQITDTNGNPVVTPASPLGGKFLAPGGVQLETASPNARAATNPLLIVKGSPSPNAGAAASPLVILNPSTNGGGGTGGTSGSIEQHFQPSGVGATVHLNVAANAESRYLLAPTPRAAAAGAAGGGGGATLSVGGGNSAVQSIAVVSVAN